MEQQSKKLLLEMNVQSLTVTTYTAYENQLLMKLLAYVQKDIKEAITQQCDKSINQVLFTAEEQASRMRHRRIPLSALETRKGHYFRTRLSLQAMTKKPIWIPFYKKPNLMEFYAAERLFSVDFEKKDTRCYAIFHFCIDTLRYYLSIAMGYHRLDLDVYLSFKHNSTRQMFRLYWGWFAPGHTQMRRGGLANLLSVDNKEKSYKYLKAELLEPARKEMKEAFQREVCDVYFEYKIASMQDCDLPQMKKLIITCHSRNENNLTASRAVDLADYKAKFWFYLKHTWQVDEKVAKSLCQRIKIWMLGELEDLMEKKKWFVENKAKKVNPHFNAAGYIVKNLDLFLTEREQEQQE